MSSVELTLYNLLKTDFHLSEEKALEFIKAIEKTQENNLDSSLKEFKSLFKEDFHRLDLKLEQLNTKIESTNNNTLKWFMGGFVTVVLMILGLFATIILK
jgi:hypothetical protein